MNYIEFGLSHEKVCLLFHGAGLSYWQYEAVAELLKEKYHVILALIEGHGQDSFESIEASASKWISFIEEHYNGHIEILGGASLGAQIAFEMAAMKPDLTKILYLESVALIKDSLTASLIPLSFNLAYPLIKQKWFSKLQFKSLHLKESLFEEYYKTTCAISKKDLIAFTKASCLYKMNEKIKESQAKILCIYGDQEIGRIKKSASLLKSLTHCMCLELKGFHHAEYGMKEAEKYVLKLEEFILKSCQPNERRL